MNMKKQPFGFDLLGDEDPGDIRAALAWSGYQLQTRYADDVSGIL